MKQVGKGWKCRNNHVRSKSIEQSGEMLFKSGESTETLVEVFFALEPSINVPPGLRPTVDEREIIFSHESIERSVRLPKQIAQRDLSRGRHAGQAIATAAT